MHFMPLSSFLSEYTERNIDNKYKPVAVGRYGIRTRESIYSKELAKDYSKNKLIFKDTLTIGMGSVQIDIGILSKDETYSVSPAYHTYRINGINPDYLKYCLECRNQDMFVRYVKKGSRQGKTIDLNRWLTYEIPVCSQDRQAEIVNIIDSVQKLIRASELQLDKLDELVKSRFIEMFSATDRFEVVPLADSVDEMFIGPFGSSLKNECFVPADQGYCMVYEQKHAIKKTLDVETRFVDEKKYRGLRRFTVQGGDIIVSCRGTIGETFIVPEGAPLGIMHPSIMKIRLKVTAYNRIFFNHLLQTILNRHEANANGSGVKMAITAKALGKEHFIRPPMALQEQFATFVAQTDKSKMAIKQSIEKLETLKKSLMQQYFG